MEESCHEQGGPSWSLRVALSSERRPPRDVAPGVEATPMIQKQKSHRISWNLSRLQQWGFQHRQNKKAVYLTKFWGVLLKLCTETMEVKLPAWSSVSNSGVRLMKKSEDAINENVTAFWTWVKTENSKKLEKKKGEN